MHIRHHYLQHIERYRGEFDNNSAILRYLLEREGQVNEEQYMKLSEEEKDVCLKMARYLAISFMFGGTRSKYG